MTGCEKLFDKIYRGKRKAKEKTKKKKKGLTGAEAGGGVVGADERTAVSSQRVVGEKEIEGERRGKIGKHDGRSSSSMGQQYKG